jgi:nuclear pore complex protein Nup98-Nup96
MDPNEHTFHSTFKPRWSETSILIHTTSVPRSSRRSKSTATDGLLKQASRPFATEGKDICFDKVAYAQPNLGVIQEHLKRSTYRIGQDNLPSATFESDCRFADYYRYLDSDDRRSRFDRLVWQLASILWDPVDSTIPPELKPEAKGYLENRLRKENLSRFWEELVHHASALQKQTAGSPEEEAIADLASHRIESACKTLVQGGNFRLATLVAMIGGDKLTRDDMRSQIDSWKKLSVISEFTDPIRAIYELIAGNTCEAEGKRGPAEDRAKSFIISQAFNMTWRQAFGLKLWYGIFDSDPLELAVNKFDSDLHKHNESVAHPTPWYAEMNSSKLWDDVNEDHRQDLLWGLLKLFAGLKTDQSTSLKEILQPANIGPNPFDYVLPWTLQQLFANKGIAGYGTKQSDVDELTISLATQLESTDELASAILVLLHLSDAQQRKASIKTLISRHPNSFDVSSKAFTTVVDAKVPPEWVWEARALHARAAGKHIEEVEFLLNARDWDEAHTAICEYVAPEAVISNDLSNLKRLLAGFENVEWVQQWVQGGQVYLDFIRLGQLRAAEEQRIQLPMPSIEKSQQIGLPKEQNVKDVVRRLLSGLPQMSREGLAGIAAAEMSKLVAGYILSHENLVSVQILILRITMDDANGVFEQSNEASKVLQLPLTEDTYLKNTMKLSLGYYKHLMASAK